MLIVEHSLRCLALFYSCLVCAGTCFEDAQSAEALQAPAGAMSTTAGVVQAWLHSRNSSVAEVRPYRLYADSQRWNCCGRLQDVPRSAMQQ